MNLSCFIFGDTTLTYQSAEMLQNNGHEVRGLVSENSEVVRWANAHGIRVINPSSDIRTALAEEPFDYLFSIGNLRMLPKEIVKSATKGAINFHDGPLPRYAGIHATSWALMNREATHGITWHFIGDIVDGGDILEQRTIDITENETALSLNAKCFEAGMDTFGELIRKLPNGGVRARAQGFSTRTYFGMWQRPDAAGVISWHHAAEDIDALVRALDLGPYPNAIGCAKVGLGADFLICKKVDVSSDAIDAEPGTITSIEPERIWIAAREGTVGMSQLLTPSGQSRSAEDLVEVYRLRVGDKLPEPDQAQRERITALNAEICKSERFWERRLSSLRTVSVPYLEANVTDDTSRVNESPDWLPVSDLERAASVWVEHSAQDIVAGAFLLFLARLGSDGRFDLGVRWSHPADAGGDFKGLVAGHVPWRTDVDLGLTAREGMDQVLKDLSAIREKKTYLLDLWHRAPELRSISERSGFPWFPIRVEFVESVDRYVPVPDCDLAFVVGKDSRCRLTCRRAVLKAENASLMVGEFRTFFKALCHKPETTVAELPLLTAAERDRMLFEWNDTASSFPRDACTPRVFEERVEQHPDAIAVAFRDQEISYSTLNAKANQLARHLKRRGLASDAPVGVLIDRSIDMVVALLGILKAGGAYLPLDPTYPKERLSFIIEDARIALLITENRFQGLLPPHRAEVVRIDGEGPAIAAEDAANLDSAPQQHHLAYVIYTSGSTGKPKGVMVEHGNVVSFFTGMDERLPHKPGDVWLAVTSLSFDISVLELFWSLCRGLKVVVYADGERSQGMASSGNGHSRRRLDFSLFYFSADQGENPADKYRLLIEGAKFADENGFAAVWTPERHFHEFGGLYPNPAVISAALATITKQVQIRAGSVVAPLHSPIRIAEEWAVVDNLSGGRVAIAFASGWMPEDFVIRPDNFKDKKEATFRHLETVRRLWRGEAVDFPGPLGKDVTVRTLPRPIQKELPVWITTAGNPETYEMAARAGGNILTHLLGQTIEEVGEKVAAYRKAWKDAGHPGRGHVSLMLHTFVGDSVESVRAAVRDPLITYLRTSASLLKAYSWAFPTFKNRGATVDQVNFDNLLPGELEAVLEFAFERYFETSGLFGTPEACVAMVDRLKAHDVDEVACLVDFGVPTELVLTSLKHLNALRSKTSGTTSPHIVATDASLPGDYSIAALIRQHGVTHFQCTPSMARMLMADAENRSAFGQLDIVMIGGEAFPTALATELRGVVNGRLVNMYGPTETTIWSGTHELGDGEGSIPIGRPILNTQFYVVSGALQPQPVGVPGELLIGGAGVTRGYLNRVELTNERFIPNPFLGGSGGRVYRTGDLVRYLPDGKVEFLGRLDHQVKIRGHRIELGEIESVLSRHPRVHEAVVVAREDVPGELRLVAYVVTRDGQRLPAEELRRFVSDELPEYMVPARVVHMDEFPQTPNRKIDRKALPPPDQNADEVKREFEPPQGPVETKLAEIWTETLGIKDIGRKDDFFRLGGNSLSLIQVTVKGETVFGRRLSIGAFLQARTLQKIASLLEDSTSGTTSSKVTQPGTAGRDITVRHMREEDLDKVIDLHLDHFSEWRVSILGRPFLWKMFRWFMENHKELALVATVREQVVGFTVGTVGPYKRSLLAYALPEVVLGAASHPAALARNGMQRVRARLRNRSRAAHDPVKSDPTLANNRISAVSSSTPGVGLELLNAFEKAAEQLGRKTYFHSDNTAHF